MNQGNIPKAHPDPWVDLTRGYVTEAISALTRRGLRVDRSWLDPSDPRDATIVYTSPTVELRALVWDEETGWRDGAFLDGRPGMRTVLSDAAYIGGGPLVRVGELARRVIEGSRSERVAYRSYRDVRDGLDDTLRNTFG